MSRPIDLTGKTFGRLTAQYYVGSKNGKRMWHCVCSCGREVDVTAYDLTSGHTRSCGCMVSRNRDLTGQRFGRLVALYPAETRSNNRIMWHCRCDCGNEVDYASTTLRSGNAVSCGCAKQGEDLTGRSFGLWTVVGKAERPQYWICRCACGNEKEVNGKSLRRGDSRSCGCLPNAFKDYTGQKRGGLTAIEATGKVVNGSPEYIWRCECGDVVALPANAVRPTENRLCPKCLAERRRQLAGIMLEKKKDTIIQDLEPGALQNIKDGALPRNNTSGVRGVWKDNKSGMWMASGNAMGKRKFIGMYADINDAAKARKKFVDHWYGDAFDILEERKQKAK